MRHRQGFQNLGQVEGFTVFDLDQDLGLFVTVRQQ
jgi:hypothetical protein